MIIWKEGSRLKKVEVVFEGKSLTIGMYGPRKPFHYDFEYDNVKLHWKTSKDLDLQEGEKYIFSGTFDTNLFYEGEEKHIVVTRCIIQDKEGDRDD